MPGGRAHGHVHGMSMACPWHLVATGSRRPCGARPMHVLVQCTSDVRFPVDGQVLVALRQLYALDGARCVRHAEAGRDDHEPAVHLACGAAAGDLNNEGGRAVQRGLGRDAADLRVVLDASGLLLLLREILQVFDEDVRGGPALLGAPGHRHRVVVVQQRVPVVPQVEFRVVPAREPLVQADQLAVPRVALEERACRARLLEQRVVPPRGVEQMAQLQPTRTGAHDAVVQHPRCGCFVAALCACWAASATAAARARLTRDAHALGHGADAASARLVGPAPASWTRVPSSQHVQRPSKCTI